MEPLPNRPLGAVELTPAGQPRTANRCESSFRPLAEGANGNFVFPLAGTVSPCPGEALADYKCLSMLQPWGTLVAEGTKTIETRTWATKHRGDLLLVASKKFDTLDWLPYVPPYTAVHDRSRALGRGAGPVVLGVALCLVDVVDCRPMRPTDVRRACCPYEPGKYAWVLENVRPVRPVAVEGQLQVFKRRLPELSA
jgi:hypothetical protein